MDQETQASEDVQRALVAENQELREENAALRAANEALVAECDEHRIGRMEHPLWKAREEVLLNQIQQLQEKVKQLSAGRPGCGCTDICDSSSELFTTQLGLYLGQNPSNNPDSDTAVVVQAGEVARRRRSQSRSRRNSRSGWEPPPLFVEPKRFSQESEGCQGPAAHLARDVPPVWLLALFRDKQWKKFSEVIRLLDKPGGHNGTLLSKMTEALQAYACSQEFQDNPQKLFSLIQELGFLKFFFSDPVSRNILFPPTSDNIKNRHSVPKTVMSINRLQQVDREMKRLSSSSCP